MIKLRAHGLHPFARDAVGFAVDRADETPLSEAVEHGKGAIRQDMSMARVTGDGANFAVLTPIIVDGSTQGEFVQNTLFVL